MISRCRVTQTIMASRPRHRTSLPPVNDHWARWRRWLWRIRMVPWNLSRVARAGHGSRRRLLKAGLVNLTGNYVFDVFNLYQISDKSCDKDTAAEHGTKRSRPRRATTPPAYARWNSYRFKLTLRTLITHVSEERFNDDILSELETRGQKRGSIQRNNAVVQAIYVNTTWLDAVSDSRKDGRPDGY